MSLAEIGIGGEFFRVVGRQEHVVERDALWGITKLKVEWDRVMDVGEALAAAAEVGAKRAGACSLCDKLFFSM